MNLLLDTHVALWAVTDSAELSGRARGLILDPGNTPWVSAVSVWEIAIKHALSARRMSVGADEARISFEEAGYRSLAVEPEHAVAVESLSDHHRDPFDRMLIAQAIVESMFVVTHDALLGTYSERVLVV